MKQTQRGFTLIELMIVVAIIGILAAVAIPSYRDYTARAQVSEAVTLAGGFKTGLSEFFTSNGNFPAQANPVRTLTAAGSTVTGKYVQTIQLSSAGSVATIQVTMRNGAPVANQIRGKTLGLTTATGGTQWICGGGGTNLEARHRPSGCK